MPTSSRAGVVDLHGPVEWGMLRFYLITLFHSTYQGNFVGFRDDVGIVPYNLR